LIFFLIFEIFPIYRIILAFGGNLGGIWGEFVFPPKKKPIYSILLTFFKKVGGILFFYIPPLFIPNYSRFLPLGGIGGIFF